MTKRKLLLKTVAGISAAAMAFSLVSYAPLDWGNEAPYAYQAYALSKPYNYTTDENGLMAWRIVSSSKTISDVAVNFYDTSVDVKGVFNEKWMNVCSLDRGFRSVLKIGDTYYYPNIESGEVYESGYHTSDSMPVKNVGLSIKVAPEYKREGKLLKLVYNVKNTSGSAVTFSFAIGSDIKVGTDDYAPIKKLDDDTGFVMVSSKDNDKDADGNLPAFTIIARGTDGANASSFWYGILQKNSIYDDENLFNDIPTDDLKGQDSVAAVTWKNITLNAGENVSLSTYISAGSEKDVMSVINGTLYASVDYANEQLTDLDSDSTYELTVDGKTYTVDSDSKGNIPLEGNDKNDTSYSLIGKSGSVKKSGGSASVKIKVADRPTAPADPAALTGTVNDIGKKSDVEVVGDSITFDGNSNAEYTVDDGKTWVKPDENGKVTFSGLTKGETVTVKGRISASDSAPASEISKGVNVIVKEILPDDVLDTNIDAVKITDNEPQGAGISCSDPDVKITYSKTIDGEFKSDIPTFTDDGIYTVYYCASKDGYLPKYGSYTVVLYRMKYDEDKHWVVIEGNTAFTDDHTYGDWETVTEAGCLNDGTEERSCTVCGYGEEKIVPATGHTLKKHEKVESSCVDGGTMEYYSCLVCGKLFADAEGTDEITDTSLPAAGHKLSEDWKINETSHYHECTVCNEKFDETFHTYGEWKIILPAAADNDGIKTRSCDICGYEQTASVKYVPNEDGTDTDLGKINNTTDVQNNACHGDISITRAEIVSKLGLTSEEQTAVENGVDVNVYLVVKDITDSISDEDKALAEDIISDNDTTAMYLDVSLFKQVEGFKPSQVTETNGTVKITFKLPEELVNTDSTVTRTYFIIRVHDGKAEKIPCTYDPATGMCSFETDKFSSYALCYADTKTNTEPEKPVKPVSYPISVSGNVTVDRTGATAGETVNVSTAFGYDIIVRDASGKVIATITEKGSFIMPESKVFITAVRNETLSLMENGWRHSYVYSYDADMNSIKVNSDAKRGKVVIDLGADYAGREFTIYSGRKSTSKLVETGTLDSNGRYVLNTADGKNYTLIVK